MSPSSSASASEEIPDSLLVKQAVLARILAVDERTIQRWHKEDLPRHGKGRGILYPLPEVIQWVRDREREQAKPAEGSDKASLDAEKTRRMRAQASLAELELAKVQGALVSVEYMDQQLAGSLQRTRLVLLNLPGKIAPQLVGVPTVARAQMILQQSIDEAMPALQAIGADPALDEDPFDG